MRKSQYSNRERKLLQKKRAWIKHGEWKRTPKDWLSKAYIKIISSKIKKWLKIPSGN